jgi:UDP-galactopyranose mutase
MHRQRTTTLRSPDDFGNVDLICFSHLRWEFVYQRPQHLMSRFAKHRRTFFVEEPVFDASAPELRLSVCPRTGVHIVVPALPKASTRKQEDEYLRQLLSSLIAKQGIRDFVAWFYTPMALTFAANIYPLVTIYDCMDELSLFRGAPPELIEQERKLFERADLVFTGGLSLFEAKCERHRQVYPFPSSVDVRHFARARDAAEDPLDQRDIPHPRIGYAGVIDERIDTELLAEVSRLRPDWHFIMIGPVVKIPIDALPKAANIHYLGMKQYSELPAYFSSWEAGMIPFALNDATRFISPTKTPEYLAAGLPVISTPIRDVVRPYGDLGLARIAGNANEFTAAIDQTMTCCMSLKWRERADAFLSTLSWDSTWNAMNHLILTAIANRRGVSTPKPEPARRAAAVAAGGLV